MIISSRQNGKIKRAASLKEKKFRSLYGEYVVEGIKMVTEAIANGVQIKEIYCLPGMEGTLPECGANVNLVEESVFSCLTETKSPQGVLAVVAIPENKRQRPIGNCVILDGVSDPGNLGTIIRTSAALGIRDIYLCDCADAFSPKVIRSSMSGIFFTEIHSFDRQTVAELTSDCCTLVGDMDGQNVFSSSIDEPYAIVIGNEANGVSDFFRRHADKTISIPMSQNIESLNAAVSFAVIAYTLANK